MIKNLCHIYINKCHIHRFSGINKVNKVYDA
jgi:hypothetical protein